MRIAYLTRLDRVSGHSGALELIEPYLYAAQGPGMGRRFFDALDRIVARS